MREEEALALIMTLFILAGAALMYSSIVTRRRMREMEHRERLAMIERGLMPSPESDPARFEAASGFVPPPGATIHERSSVATAVRYRTAGVLMIGLGLGLIILITFTAGQASVGIGVGGAWAVLGAASLLNYFLMSSRDTGYGSQLPPRWAAPASPAPRPQEPPSNVAP